jgi:hypothetical protein
VNEAIGKRAAVKKANKSKAREKVMAIDTGSDLKEDADPEGVANMVPFDLYSELTKKVQESSDGAGRVISTGLVPADGDGKQEEDSESSFEFDVQPDDIYDLTVF